MITDRLKLVLLAGFWTSILFFPAIAQPGGSTIQLTVKDQFGGAVAGAEITLSVSGRDGKGSTWSARTDQRGLSRVVKLPDGEYQLVVIAKGFKDYKQQGLSLRGEGTQNIEIVLEVAPIESNVDVGEDETVSAENTGGSTVISERVIADLPDDPEELERALKRLGQAVTGEDLPISVNGIQGGKLPPKDAIQQVRVNQNVFSAQYEGNWGGGIEVFTRSSVDRYRGYFGFSFADARLNASDPFIGERVPYQMKNYFFSLSGPLLGKKANFNLFGTHTGRQSSSVINAIILDGNLQPVEFKQSLLTPNRGGDINFTVNADPTPKHKLYVNYYLSVARAENQNTGGFSLPSRANDTRSQNHYVQFSETFLINPNVVNQTRFLASYSKNDSFGGSDDYAVNVLDAFFGGGSQQNSSIGVFRFEALNDTTWQMGRYALGFGFRIRGERIAQTSSNNFGGTYTFSGRVAPVLDSNNQPVIGDDGSILTTEISSLETYRRTLLFRQLGFTNQRIRELGGGANQFTISGGDPRLEAAQYDVSTYVQNSYKISETLAASFGLRYEGQTNISSRYNFAPRLGFIWSPKAKDKQNPLTTLPRVSVGYGVFYSRFALNNTVVVRQASDADRLQYLITETNVLDIFPGVPTVDALQQFALPRTQRFISELFETSYTALLNVTVNKRLPKGLTLNFTFSRGEAFRRSITQNINAPLAGTFDPRDPSTAVRPFGNVGNIYETRSLGNGKNNRYSLNLSFPQNNKFFASLRYSFGRLSDNAVGSSGSPFDPYDFSQEFASGSFDGVHNVGGFYSFALTKTFSVTGDFSINTGTRFNITTGRDTNGDGSFSERPAFASDMSKPGLVETPYGILDPNPAPGDRLIPRNLGRGTSAIYFNSAVSKMFGFNEDKAKKTPPKQVLRFTLRVNNVFNIVNQGNPIGNMSSPNFLRSLSTYSDGSTFFINGVQQDVFAGRSMTLNASISF